MAKHVVAVHMVSVGPLFVKKRCPECFLRLEKVGYIPHSAAIPTSLLGLPSANYVDTGK